MHNDAKKKNNDAQIQDEKAREREMVQYAIVQEQKQAAAAQLKQKQAAAVAAPQAPSSKKACGVCTYLNNSSHKNCEMCGMPLPLQGGGSYNEYLTNKYSFKQMDAM